MLFSPPTLHRQIAWMPRHLVAIEQALKPIRKPVSHLQLAGLTRPSSIAIPLTTVSLDSNFDAFINVSFAGAMAGSATAPLVVDSGNSILIMPRWEDLAAIPNWAANYQVLGTASEPWGCLANVVRGPIDLITAEGTNLRIDDCVFLACTADNAEGRRTANFGAGCLSPWSANQWSTPNGLNVTLQAPLSYKADYPFMVFNYAAAATIHGAGSDPKIAAGSFLTLFETQPSGFAVFDIIQNVEWMSLTPKSLTIGSVKTQWPGDTPRPLIAMIDTGGGPIFLSDPKGYLVNAHWPDPAANPDWTSDTTPPSKSCQSIQGAISVEVGDATGSYAYSIDPLTFPVSARGLTLVMCEDNYFMMGQQGINIGGISALTNLILVNYADGKVGFKAR